MFHQRLLDRIDREWKALLDSVEGLSSDAMLEPGAVGGWSVRDVLAHVTSWDEEALKALPLILEGRRLPRYSDVYGGIDAFNAQQQERRKGLSLEQVMRELEETHQRLVAYLSRMPEVTAEKRDRLRRRLRQDSCNHYREHVSQIAAWRTERWPSFGQEADHGKKD